MIPIVCPRIRAVSHSVLILSLSFDLAGGREEGGPGLCLSQWFQNNYRKHTLVDPVPHLQLRGEDA